MNTPPESLDTTIVGHVDRYSQTSPTSPADERTPAKMAAASTSKLSSLRSRLVGLISSPLRHYSRSREEEVVVAEGTVNSDEPHQSSAESVYFQALANTTNLDEKGIANVSQESMTFLASRSLSNVDNVDSVDQVDHSDDDDDHKENAERSAKRISLERVNIPLNEIKEIPMNDTKTDFDKTTQKIATYSQDDVDRIRLECEERFEQQYEFLQLEVQTLQEKYTATLKTNHELQSVLEEYEKTLTQIIDARRRGDVSLASVEQLSMDKQQLQVELQTARISFANLHQRCDDFKSLTEQLRIVIRTMMMMVDSLLVVCRVSEA